MIIIKKQKKLFEKLIVSNIIMVFIVVFIIVLTIYNVSINEQIKDAKSFDKQLVENISNSFDGIALSYKNLLNYITLSEDFQQILTESNHLDNNPQENYILLKQLIDNITQKTILVNDIHSIYLYNNNEMIASFIKTYKHGENVKSYNKINEDWFSKLGDVTLTYDDGNLLFNRRIKSISTMQDIGYVSLVVSPDIINEKLKLIKTNDSRYIVVTDKFNNVIVSNHGNRANTDNIIKNISLDNVNTSTVQRTGFLEYTLVTVYYSNLTGLKITSYIPMTEFMRSPGIISKWIIISSLIGIAIGSFFTYSNAKRLVKPINRLIFATNQLENGNFNIQVTESGYSEIAILSKHVNNMAFKINNLIEQVYKEEIKRKDAELKTLQMQINPHFFYNTLDTINWLAEFNKTSEIRVVTTSIAKLMKESLNNKRKFNSLAAEIDYIKSYLDIYKITLDNKFSYSIDISKDVQEKQIPKFLLQPIVENAINHGIRLKIGYTNINIVCFLKEQDIYIDIFDNGIGISEEKLAFLNGESNEAETAKTIEHSVEIKTTGLGLKSTRERIKLIYGEDSYLIVESNQNLGTLVKIKINDLGLGE